MKKILGKWWFWTIIAVVVILIVAAAAVISRPKVVPNKLIKESTIKEMSGSTIVLDDGTRVELPTNVEDSFRQSEKLRNSLKEKGYDYESSSVVKEYRDRIIIEETTVTEVPPETGGSGSSSSGTEGSGNESHKNDSSGNESGGSGIPNPFNESSMRRTADEFLKKCHSGPLCSMSKDELLGLLENKSGADDSKYIISEKLQISKIPHFDFENILRDRPLLKNPESVFVPVFALDIKPWTIDDNDDGIVVVSELSPMQYAGLAHYEDVFINGFTLGYEMNYEFSKGWSVLGRNVAETTVGAYAGFGVGIRLPFKVMAEMPSLKNSDDPEYQATVTIEPLDLDEAGYREAGISQHQLFDGKELVMKIGAEIYFKAELLGQEVADMTIGRIIDNSRDFKPPMLDERLTIDRIVFHGYDTGLFQGDEKAYVEGNIGVEAAVKGDKYTIDLEPVNTEGAPSKLIFRDKLSQTMDLTAKASADHEDEFGKYGNFGFVMKNPKYYPMLAIILQLGVAVSVDTGDVLGTIDYETPWISLYEFNLPLPYLSRHPGTTEEIRADKNKEYIIVHSWEEVIQNMGNMFVNQSRVCEAVNNLIKPGAEVTQLSEARINIRTFDNEPIGSVRIEDGVVDTVSCKHLFNNPTHKVLMESYQTLFDMGNSANRGTSFYDLFLQGVNDGTVRIEGEGSNSILTSIGVFGVKIFGIGGGSPAPQTPPAPEVADPIAGGVKPVQPKTY